MRAAKANKENKRSIFHDTMGVILNRTQKKPTQPFYKEWEQNEGRVYVHYDSGENGTFDTDYEYYPEHRFDEKFQPIEAKTDKGWFGITRRRK